MPAHAKDGKVVCFFQSAQKFKTRYATGSGRRSYRRSRLGHPAPRSGLEPIAAISEGTRAMRQRSARVGAIGSARALEARRSVPDALTHRAIVSVRDSSITSSSVPLDELHKRLTA